MTWAIEVTDTFGGEANYSWVRRLRMESREGESNRSIVRRAKALEGWNGMRCETENYGDSFTLRPVGRSAPCWVMFINWDDSPASDEESDA
jgi:hypothetical protein